VPDHVAGPTVSDEHCSAGGAADTGEILLSHIRSIDTEARPIRYAGAAVPPDVAWLVRAKLESFITI
jgi:hypothetical protein